MIRQGTVWPVTPQGIQDPSNPTRYLPLGSFLEPGTQFDMGSEKTWKAVYMHSVLNVIARVRQAPGDYTTLERKYLPKSWNNRLSKSRAVPETEFDSNDENNGAPSEEFQTLGSSEIEETTMIEISSVGSDDGSDDESDDEADDEPDEGDASVYGNRQQFGLSPFIMHTDGLEHRQVSRV